MMLGLNVCWMQLTRLVRQIRVLKKFQRRVLSRAAIETTRCEVTSPAFSVPHQSLKKGRLRHCRSWFGTCRRSGPAGIGRVVRKWISEAERATEVGVIGSDSAITCKPHVSRVAGEGTCPF